MVQQQQIIHVFPQNFKHSAKKILNFPLMLKSRAELLMSGIEPLFNSWSRRGATLHRTYLEQFLQEYSPDIKGHCLEFQEDFYTSYFGGSQVTKLDILNKETDNPNATIIADLTQPNDIPSNTFDCIICTYTLHIIADLDYMIRELHRILKPGGVLLVSVPDITVNYSQYNELWRFTAKGLHLLLAKAFGDEKVTVKTYGNSVTAAGELRGLSTPDFTKAQLNYHDPRYALVVCARSIKKPENLS
jgi:SAM-dependent methyltransferase